MRRSAGFLLLSWAMLALESTLFTAHAESGNAEGALRELSEMSLEELADIEISSVSKRTEKRTGAAAAVYVITQEDIRRSTAVTLPDLLRMVPGLHVASLDASTRSISSRGFSGRYANSLLVMVDGRSIYSPLFSGTEWEIHDYMLEDVERIEIIRGPGGALWGANAVNGVINVITKNAADTQGGLLTLGTGTEYPALSAIRYGDRAGESGAYRLHLRYLRRDDGGALQGQSADDDAVNARGGARFDWDWGDSQLTIIGDLYAAQPNGTYEIPSLLLPVSEIHNEATYYSGGSLLGRWVKTFGDDGILRVHASYDHTAFNNFLVDEDRDNADLELQYQAAPMGRHEFSLGFGLRYYDDRTRGSSHVYFQPSSISRRLFSAFVQDRIALIEDKLTLTLGTKIEHNDFTGIELQPSARIAWTPDEDHTLWAAVSRAVRTPSFGEDSGVVAGFAVPGVILGIFGNDSFGSETLLAYEVGYRVRLTEEFQVDLALFYNRYQHLRTQEFGLPFFSLSRPYPHLAVPIHSRDNMSGATYGAEISIDWAIRTWWRVRLNYAMLEMDLHPNPETFDTLAAGIEDSSPEQQVFLASYMEFGKNVDLDLFFRYVDQLPALGIDDYVTADVRLAWRPSDDFEIAIVGHNLLESGHLEYDSTFVNTVPTAMQRGVYGSITWQF